jgi:hypothetical protein
VQGGEKEESLKVLQNEKDWIIWYKASPKDRGEQAFREHSRCIFTGRYKESNHKSQKLVETWRFVGMC